jgi:hypothetical protein
LDSFDDRYLGTKTSDPTLDNDGNALAAGALYFSTTENVMKVYDGASWIAATSAGATSLLRFRYVATSGQTTFSGADAASATLTYTVNNIAVHRNGVTLDTSEYTASNGTSIVLTVAAGTGDIVDIIAFKSFTVADALSAVSGGTVNGPVTVTGALTTNGAFVAGGTMKGASTIGVGGATASASGAGITFPSGVSHYSTDANTLDDYEEGSWTPVLDRDSTPATIVYSVQVGRYVKIGSMVYCMAEIGISSISSAGSGLNKLTGLPFTSENTGTGNGGRWGGVIEYSTALPTAITNYVISNNTFCYFGNGAGGNPNANYATAEMYVLIVYRAAN